jgi:SAM-dependent methyltransferase
MPSDLSQQPEFIPAAEEPACPLCDGPVRERYQLARLSQRLSLGSVAKIFWCDACDAGFLFPRPTPEANALLYDDSYFSQCGQAPAIRRPRTLLDRVRVHVAWRFDLGARGMLDLVKRYLGTCSAQVCELGCGNGEVLNEFARAGFQTVGVEPAESAIRTARSRGLNVLAGTAEHLPVELPLATFDIVLLCQVLEHCHHPVLAVRSALSLLRPEGFLFIDVPNCGSFQFRDRGLVWFHADPGRHVNYFTIGALRRLLARENATELGTYYCQYLDHFLDYRIDLERLNWEGKRQSLDASHLEGLPPVSRLRLLGTLLRTCALPPDRKYGIVGVIARREHTGRE